jgi:hypothetical protein
MIMQKSTLPVCTLALLCAIFICSLPVAAADANIEADLGDTLTLHGVSYTSSQVYLFLTGPGLPENGVTLNDVTQRADQGKFTTVDVDSDQKWSMRWNTARIENEIDPGTYTVYVTTEPVDKANLGGTSTYKTLEVFLKDSGISKVSVSTGTSYTLNPELHTSVDAPAINLQTPSPVPTILPTTAAPVIITPVSLKATTKASVDPVTPLLAGLFCAGCLCLIRRK